MSRPVFSSHIVAAALFAGAWATPAAATGYWNLPSNWCQCLGYGFGAGHHAPLILGPATWDGICAHHEMRLPYAPTPPYGACSCAGGGASFASPTFMQSIPPTPLPASEPISRRPRPLFLR